MQRMRRDDDVERPSPRRGPRAGSGGSGRPARERVDPEHVVAGDRQPRRQLALAAADVEHARRRRRKVRLGEVEKRRLSHDGGDYGERDGRPPSCRFGAGFAARYRRATGPSVEATIRRLSCVQLDSISTVERSHRIASPAASATIHRRQSRGYSPAAGSSSTGHMRPACSRSSRGPSSVGDGERRPRLVRGRRKDASAPRRRDPGGDPRARPARVAPFRGRDGRRMWNWKPAKAMLERLWNHGDLVIAGRQGFQRIYDLAERVIPRAQLDAPVPSEHEMLRTFAKEAVRAASSPRPESRSTGVCGAASPCAARDRRARRRGATAAAASRRRRRRRARGRGGGARPAGSARRRYCCRRSTTCSGTDPSRGGSSASTI